MYLLFADNILEGTFKERVKERDFYWKRLLIQSLTLGILEIIVYIVLLGVRANPLFSLCFYVLVKDKNWV